jgi:hypothetical protein
MEVVVMQAGQEQSAMCVQDLPVGDQRSRRCHLGDTPVVDPDVDLPAVAEPGVPDQQATHRSTLSLLAPARA